jgi:hypothetical protein
MQQLIQRYRQNRNKKKVKEKTLHLSLTHADYLLNHNSSNQEHHLSIFYLKTQYHNQITACLGAHSQYYAVDITIPKIPLSNVLYNSIKKKEEIQKKRRIENKTHTIQANRKKE